MGFFYTNVTLQGPTRDQLIEYLTQLGRQAYLSPNVNGVTVVYDQECENQDVAVLSGLTSQLSAHFHCPALVALLHDDDIFLYQAYQNGELIDEYDSTPGYFDRDAGWLPPSGGDATKLCAAFGVSSPEDIGEVDAILHYSDIEADDDDQDLYYGPEERHQDLAEAIGFPPFAASMGYYRVEAIEEGCIPEERGIARSELMKISA